MASIQGRFRPSHNPKPHMLAGRDVIATRGRRIDCFTEKKGL
jgi:hypothetical protein